jgi:hypothetical protein
MEIRNLIKKNNDFKEVVILNYNLINKELNK